MKKITVGSDFSGVGAFNQALHRLGVDYREIFACDKDKYARQTFIHNYGEPEDFPEDVYDREIPSESLDIYATSPPCQSFSLAGKRLGKDDKRGILFFNSHEFIKKNKPRYFIFENVKGLLSDSKKSPKSEYGETFSEWLSLLGGKSVNEEIQWFTNPEAVPYHIYWTVLNAKDLNVPQNRERVFIVGIRDDEDNNFSWPAKQHLEKKLKDVLETDVDEKYFLSDNAVSHLFVHKEKHDKKGTGFGVELKDENDIASTLRANGALCPTDNHLKVKSATSSGYETATENDSINFSVPNSKTRSGRVGKEVAQTLDTQCNQGIIQLNNPKHSNDRVYSDEGISPTLNTMQGGNRKPFCCIPVLTPDRPEKRQNGRRFKEDGDPSFTLTAQDKHGIFDGYKIRRLTPRECFRLMDFPDTFTWNVSDSQAYKQAGNSVVVKCYYEIIKRFNLK